jgi:hypothetical protein
MKRKIVKSKSRRPAKKENGSLAKYKITTILKIGHFKTRPEAIKFKSHISSQIPGATTGALIKTKNGFCFNAKASHIERVSSKVSKAAILQHYKSVNPNGKYTIVRVN